MHLYGYGKTISRKDFEYMINLIKKYETKSELLVLTMSEGAEKVIKLENAKK